MAAPNETNKDQLQLYKDRAELQLLRQRLWIPLQYNNEALFGQFTSPVGGIGLQAFMNIPRGTPLISERELFSVKKDRYTTIQQANMVGFGQLSCPFPQNQRTQRFNTNNWEMSGGRRGIFLLASRFNHSCIPNAHVAWNRQLDRLTVHAIVDIPNDAEIFVNYRCKDFFKTTPDRNDKLNRHYNFICNCLACQPNTVFEMASAVRRDQVRDLKNYNYRHRNATTPDERNKQLANIKLIVLMLHQEGLFYPQLADYLHEEIKWYCKEMEFAETANEVEDHKYIVALRGEALQVAGKKLEWDVRCLGYNSPEVAQTLELIVDLRDDLE